MTIHLRRSLPWIAAWLALAATGEVWLARAELTSLRESFEVDARIMHRLLSQRASQHDAVLATLGLLQSQSTEAERERRLSSVYPQVIAVEKHALGTPWPKSANAAALGAAEDASRAASRPVLGPVDFQQSQYWLLLAFMREFDRTCIGAIVLDVRMSGISGLTVLDTLMREGVDQPIIVLIGHGTVKMGRRAFKSGAAEFLEKPVDDEALLEALQNAVRQHVRSRERNNADRESRERYALLSEREREVLGLIVAGLTNKEIGRALTLSPRTVETHRANLFAKLEVESLAVLIRRFARLTDDEHVSRK